MDKRMLQYSAKLGCKQNHNICNEMSQDELISLSPGDLGLSVGANPLHIGMCVCARVPFLALGLFYDSASMKPLANSLSELGYPAVVVPLEWWHWSAAQMLATLTCQKSKHTLPGGQSN
eukprot:4579420-Amphidinium_carterae.1